MREWRLTPDGVVEPEDGGPAGPFTALAQAVPPERVGEHVGAMVQMAARIIQGART